MLISGNWVLGDDNIIRPIVKCGVLAADGSWKPCEFLVDSGADRTVFMAQFLSELALPHLHAPDQLGGVGGAVTTVAVGTQIRFEIVGGGTVLFQGNFSAFTQPDALDMNILGRDIMNLFAVVLDRHADVVCMIGKGHRYSIGVQP